MLEIINTRATVIMFIISSRHDRGLVLDITYEVAGREIVLHFQALAIKLDIWLTFNYKIIFKCM